MKIKELVREKGFRLSMVELAGANIAFIVEYRGRRSYIPPLISSDRIPLPKKYMCFFDRTIFPEIVPTPYGRTRG